MAKLSQPVRYYITSDDDRPVVRSIPVTVREDAPAVDTPRRDESPSGVRKDTDASTRVARLVRSAVRRAPGTR